MKSRELIGGLFWLLIGLGFACGGFFYGIGSWISPGPGSLPMVFGIILAALSSCLIALAFTPKREPEHRHFWQAKGSWKPVLFTSLSLVAYMGLLELFGLVLTTFLFVFFLLKLVGGKRWLPSIMVAAALSILCGLSSDLLQTPLPKGRIFSASGASETSRL